MTMPLMVNGLLAWMTGRTYSADVANARRIDHPQWSYESVS
jgi:hypothetical protein